MEVSSYCAICAQPSVCVNGTCLHRALYLASCLFAPLYHPHSFNLSLSLSPRSILILDEIAHIQQNLVAAELQLTTSSPTTMDA